VPIIQACTNPRKSHFEIERHGFETNRAEKNKSIKSHKQISMDTMRGETPPNTLKRREDNLDHSLRAATKRDY